MRPIHRQEKILPALPGALLWLFVATAATANTSKGYYQEGDPNWDPPGRDSPPTWSRDGKEVLFQQTRDEGIAQIWAISPTGSGLRRVTDGTFAAGHPNACAQDDRLALISDRDGGREIYVLGMADAILRRLTTAGADKSWPVFSPDCREIVYVETHDRSAGRYDLKTVDVATGETRLLLAAVRYLGWPTWSADGQWVLFHREIAGYPNHLWRVRRDGRNAQALSEGDHGDYWSAHMSSDGRRLSYAYNPRSQLQWGINADLWVMDRKDGRCSRIRGGAWHEHGQRWSPEGRRMVYWDQREGYNEVFVIDLESRASRQLTFQPPGELTRIARREGELAAIEARASQPDGVAPYSESAMAALLTTWANRGHPPAIRLAELYRHDFPQSSAAREALAREKFRASQLRNARQDYLELLTASPDDGHSVSRLGFLAALEQVTGRTLAQLEDEKLPMREVNRLGYAVMRQGDSDLAIDVFRWLVRSQPSSWNAYDSLGEALYWRGDHEAAQAAYESSLRLNGENENARRFLRRIASAPLEPEPVPCPDWPSELPSESAN